MPTIFDVAKAAGVSHQTVSRVLNGDPSVRERTRDAVQEAIGRLGYRPNALARNLARRRTRTIGLLVVGMPFHGPGGIALGFNAAAQEAGWDVAIAASDEAKPEQARVAAAGLLSQGVRVLVVIAPGPEIGAALEGIAGDVPVVTSTEGVVPGASVVAVDDVGGAELAVEHLAALGHREILHVSGPAGWTEAQQRRDAWRAAAERLGVAAPAPIEGDWTSASGYRIGVELARTGVPEAIFSANDQTALGLLAAFREAGVRVPEDVSLVGFDDLPEAAYFSPALTTVRQDFHALGEALMLRVGELLDGGPAASADRLPTTLVVRASTAPR